MNKPLILVVEDDAPVRSLITTTLRAHDYRFLSAANGESAILEASSHNPDIMLLDLGLPDLDGVEVIHRVRTWSNLPIIVISDSMWSRAFFRLPTYRVLQSVKKGLPPWDFTRSTTARAQLGRR